MVAAEELKECRGGKTFFRNGIGGGDLLSGSCGD